MKNKQLENRFKYLKKLINDKNDIKERIDILLMTDEAKNVCEVQNKLFEDYESNYASSIWNNYVECMSKEVSK